MFESSISAKDLDMFTRTIGDILRRIGSLESFESWLKMQPSVVLVDTADHIIKTEPPRKEVSVTFQMDDGSTVTHVIDVILYPDQTFGLAGVHER